MSIKDKEILDINIKAGIAFTLAVIAIALLVYLITGSK